VYTQILLEFSGIHCVQIHFFDDWGGGGFTSKLSVVVVVGANPLPVMAEVLSAVGPEVSDKFLSSSCPVYHPDRKVPFPFCLPNHDASGSPCRRPGS